jgi:DNA-binding transcriptional LysR family regulator
MDDKSSARALEVRRRAPIAVDDEAGSRLKLAHLRLIAALADTGMISAAAKAVGITQPAASRRIAELESLLNAPLCDRVSRGVRLTPLGQALARHAQSVLLHLAQAEREFADLRAGRRGAVAFGAVTGPAVEIAAPAMARVRAAAPGVDVNIRIDASNALARELLASRLDFIIAHVPDDLDPQAFESLPIGVEEACILVRRAHPLLGRGPATLADAGVYEWVTQPRGTPLHRAVDTLFQVAGLAAPGRFLTTTSVFLTMTLVAGSDALAPMASAAARFISREGAPGKLAILPTAFSVVVQPYSLIALRNRALSPAAQTVYDIVREQAFSGAPRTKA